jgi:hypothetical protein
MIIRDNSGNVKVRFQSLDMEDVFRCEGEVCMKLDLTCHSLGGHYNAYSFKNHMLTKFPDDMEVEYVPSELFLHEKGWTEQ